MTTTQSKEVDWHTYGCMICELATVANMMLGAEDLTDAQFRELCDALRSEMNKFLTSQGISVSKD